MLRTRLTRRAVGATVLTLALASSLSGCALGFNTATTSQLASGNGANANLGSLQIRDITIVAGPDGTSTATLIGTIVNRGQEADALTGVTIKDPAGTATIGGTAAVGGTLPLAASSSTRIGYNSEDHVDITGLATSPTQYVRVQLSFEKSGSVELDVMAVPPTGIYAGITPLAG